MAYRICLIEGDGIGHEVIPAARRVLEATGLPLEFVEAEAGWETFERRGTSVPEETVEKILSCHATLFGAATSPTRKVPGFFGAIRYLRRRLSQELERAKRHLSLLSSLQGSPGSREGSTEGRNFLGAHPWQVLRAGTFLPLLGREVPRDLSLLKPILFGGSWEGWRGGLGPHPGGGPECANVRST